MKTHDWNPELYLKYEKERNQPSTDLVSRINYSNPNTIIDIGCGPGNSTQALYQKWPDSEIVGIDNSPAMIQKAAEDYPGQKWMLLDVAKETIEGKYDIIFSNATMQWLPNHEKLINEFYHLLNLKGILAVQLPLFFDMPVSKSISETASNPKWQAINKEVKALFTIHDTSFYYEQLSSYFSQIEIWVTDYYHIMESHQSIFEMIRSTGLRPYYERFNSENDKKEFETLVLEGIEKYYPLQSNGKVLFPFKRLFFVAKK